MYMYTPDFFHCSPVSLYALKLNFSTSSTARLVKTGHVLYIFTEYLSDQKPKWENILINLQLDVTQLNSEKSFHEYWYVSTPKQMALPDNLGG